MSINLGATVETAFTTSPAETGTLVVTAPDGTVSTPTVTGAAGSQVALFEVTQVGVWTALWESPNAGQHTETFTVGPQVVTVAQVKAALNTTATVDDAELQRMLDGALAEYAEWVGPLPGTKTVRTSGGTVVLPRGAVAVTAATAGGSAVSTTDYDLDVESGILYGAGTYSSRQLILTVTIGALPAHHREAIVADVAGLFTATQRGGGSNAPRFVGEGYADALEVQPGRPVVLFPRIRALASVSVA